MNIEEIMAPVREAAQKLRKPRGVMAARMSLARAMYTAREDLSDEVARFAPGLRAWLRRTPDVWADYTGRAAANDLRVAEAAEDWCREAPGFAAARMSEAMGLGTGADWLRSVGLKTAPSGSLDASDALAIRGHTG